MTSRIGAVIVAAGRGTRLGGDVPKQLLDLGGQSLLQRSIAAFDTHPAIAEIAVVLPAELVDRGRELAGPVRRPMRVVAGGARRQDSVRLGVEGLSPDVDLILIHDAARPFVGAALIDRVIAGAAEAGAALPALPCRDTVKRVDATRAVVTSTLPREEIWLAQTPQGFRRDVMAQVLAHSDRVDATDEAMLAERAGVEVRVVPGDFGNIKITTMDELSAARSAMNGSPRVGTGYDLHRLADGRPLVLAGVHIPFERGPLGHSDGDVVCHAIVDALLGAAAAGDIGRHFSNIDPRWKDAAGLDLLARAAAILEASGCAAASVDVTVVLERPKLASHIDAIRTALAGVLGIAIDRVSVKAKTNEGVDAVGRGEAIAAHAVAVVVDAQGGGRGRGRS